MDEKPLLFYEYIAMIRYSMSPKERKEIDVQTLYDFVNIINKSYKSKYPIPLSWLAKWLGYKEIRTLKDFLLQRRRKGGNHVYTKEIDYKVVPTFEESGQKSKSIFLTLACFKDICQQVPMEKAHTIRKYFTMTEALYRDAIQMKMSNRRQNYKSEEEIESAYAYDDDHMPGDGNITYFDLIIQHGMTFYKVGHTKQGRIRLVNLRGDYPGKHQYAKVIRIHENVALEEIIKAISERWMISCSKPPCPKEIILTKNFPVNHVLTAARAGLDTAFRTLKDLESEPLSAQEIPGTPSDSSAPFMFRRRGQYYLLKDGQSKKVFRQSLKSAREKNWL